MVPLFHRCNLRLPDKTAKLYKLPTPYHSKLLRKHQQ